MFRYISRLAGIFAGIGIGADVFHVAQLHITPASIAVALVVSFVTSFIAFALDSVDDQ
jgi:hypothetical protein